MQFEAVSNTVIITFDYSDEEQEQEQEFEDEFPVYEKIAEAYSLSLRNKTLRQSLKRRETKKRNEYDEHIIRQKKRNRRKSFNEW